MMNDNVESVAELGGQENFLYLEPCNEITSFEFALNSFLKALKLR
jgi:hypothetical protein